MSNETLENRLCAYRRIAKALHLNRSRASDQPTLNEVAMHLELSAAHRQRLVHRWAGIGPKPFLQFLTGEDIKRRLATTRDLLGLTLDTGLSSPGRPHELLINLEAMMPGEFKPGGRGLEIRFGVQPSPFGSCLTAFTGRGICQLQFDDDISLRAAKDAVKAHWPEATARHDSTGGAQLVETLFDPTVVRRRTDALVLQLKGTDFQIQVWRALLAIPPGAVTTYRDLAVALGRPQAARAVGNALGANPVAYLIPCHRVIRQTGEFGNYRWGPDRKAAMLAWEASASGQPYHPSELSSVTP